MREENKPEKMDPKELPPIGPTQQWSMVVIRDSSSTQNDVVDSIFPPSNHENLIPFSDNNLKDSPPSPTSPFSFSPSDSDLPPSPPPPHAVAVVPGWWGFAIRILRAKIENLGKRRAFWSFGKVVVSVVALVWWLSVRMRRRWRRGERVGQLLEVIKQKDEKIIQLLNQIVEMNQLLLARHKLQAPKLAG